MPAVRKGLRLHPEGDEPDAFRIDLTRLGSGSTPVVFSRDPGGRMRALYVGIQALSFHKQPGIRDPRPFAAAALAAGVMALASAGTAKGVPAEILWQRCPPQRTGLELG